jgi:hypothetical protein
MSPPAASTGDEIERDVVGAGSRDVFGREVIFLRTAVPPGAAMGEDEDGRVRPVGAEDIELLDVRRAISVALRIAKRRRTSSLLLPRRAWIWPPSGA